MLVQRGGVVAAVAVNVLATAMLSMRSGDGKCCCFGFVKGKGNGGVWKGAGQVRALMLLQLK